MALVKNDWMQKNSQQSMPTGGMSTPSTSYQPAMSNFEYPSAGEIFKQVRTYTEKGETKRALTLMSGLTESMRTPGSKYYQPYYTSYDPDQQYESATIDMENDLQQMYRDVQVAVAKGYSDAWITNNITASNYKNIEKARKAALNGEPSKFTRQVGYLGDDTIYGMIYAARNGDEYSGDMLSSVARYYMGYGKQYTPDARSEAARDRTSETWNPYAFGGASASENMNKYCSKYGVTQFTREWMDAHSDEIAKNGDSEKLYKILDNTEEAERQVQRFKETCIQRLKMGESADDIYDLYFGDDMNRLKKGGDSEEKYDMLANMEYARQHKDAYDLAYEVPFSAYEIKSWLKDAEEAVKVDNEKQAIKTQADMFGNAVPDEYQANVLMLYELDTGKMMDFDNLSSTDLAELNNWLKGNGLYSEGLKAGETNAEGQEVQGPVPNSPEIANASFKQAYDAVLKRIEGDQYNKLKEEAESVQPTPDFRMDEFIAQSNATDSKGNQTAEAAHLNTSFRLGLRDYFSGKPVTDPNTKAFIQNLGKYVMDKEKATSLEIIAFGAVTVTDSESNRMKKIGGAYESRLSTVESQWQNGFISDDDYFDALIRVAQRVDNWRHDQTFSGSFEEWAKSNGADDEDTAYFHDIIQKGAEKQETERLNKGITTADGYFNAKNNLSDERSKAYYDAVQGIDVTNVDDKGYKDTLTKLEAYGNSYLGEEGYTFTLGNASKMQSENRMLCAQAGIYVDELMKVAKASGLTFDELCQVRGIDTDQLVAQSYQQAYNDYADAVAPLDNVLKTIMSMPDNALPAKANNRAIVNMLGGGTISREEYDKAAESMGEENVNYAITQALQARGGAEGAVMDKLRDGDTDSYAAALYRSGNSEKAEQAQADYRQGASASEQAAGTSANALTVLGAGIENGVLIFKNNAVTATAGWLKRDPSYIENQARQEFTPVEYREALMARINEIDDPDMRAAYQQQLDDYHGDIYKFEFDNWTIGLEETHEKLNRKQEAMDSEMKDVLTPGAYRTYTLWSSAVNSMLLSAPTVAVTAITKDPEGIAALFAQLASTGYIEGGTTAYELQKMGASVNESKRIGVNVGVATAVSEWKFDGLVNQLTFKSGIVKSIENATSINAVSRSSQLANFVYAKTQSEGLTKFAKASSYAFLNTLNWGMMIARGAVGESVQEVQQEYTSDQLKGIYAEQKSIDDYMKVFGDSFWSGIMQSATTGAVAQVKAGVAAARGTNLLDATRKTDKEGNEIEGTSNAEKYAGSIAQDIQRMQAEAEFSKDTANRALSELQESQGVINEQERVVKSLEEQLNDMYAERYAGLNMMQDAESAARVELGTAQHAADAAVELHNSDLVKNIQQTEQESAELTSMLADLEASIDAVAQLAADARQTVEEGNVSPEAIKYLEATTQTLADKNQQAENTRKKINENQRKIDEWNIQRRAQAMNIEKQARQQAIEEETQRRIEEEQKKEAQKQADLYALRDAKEAQLKQAREELEQMKGLARQRAQDVLDTAKNSRFGMYSPEAVRAAELIFKQLEGSDGLATAREITMKQGLKEGIELSFPGKTVEWVALDAGTDAQVVTVDEATQTIQINANATIAQIMGGILGHETGHLAEVSKKYSEAFKAATRAVIGDAKQVQQYVQNKVNELLERNPGMTTDTTKPNNVISVALHEVYAETIAKILSPSNIEGSQSINKAYKLDWAKALINGDALLAKDMYDWLNIRIKEVEKFARMNRKNKSVQQQYQGFAEAITALRDALIDAGENPAPLNERGNAGIDTSGIQITQVQQEQQEAPAEPKADDAAYSAEQRDVPAERVVDTLTRDEGLGQAELPDNRVAGAEQPTQYADEGQSKGEVRTMPEQRVVAQQTQQEAPAEQAPRQYADEAQDKQNVRTLPENRAVAQERQAEAEVSTDTIVDEQGNDISPEAISEEFSREEEALAHEMSMRGALDAIKGPSQESRENLYKSILNPNEREWNRAMFGDEALNKLIKTAEGDHISLATDDIGLAPIENEKGIDERIDEDFTDKNVKPFYQQHWDLFHFARDMADVLLDDVANTMRGQRMAIRDYAFSFALNYGGVTRNTSNPIEVMRDEFGWSYSDIETRLKKFVDAYDNGTKLGNYKWVKQLEYLLNDLLTNGYTSDIVTEGSPQLTNKTFEKYNQLVGHEFVRSNAAINLEAQRRVDEMERQQQMEQAQDSEGESEPLPFMDEDAEQSSGFMNFFNQSKLAQMLQTKLEQAYQENDEATYRGIAGRIRSIIQSMRPSDSNNAQYTPIEVLKRLTDKLGSHIYERVKINGERYSQYMDFSRGILTNKAAATAFTDLMEDVSHVAFDKAGIAETDESGNVTVNGTTYTAEQLNQMFLNWMTQSDSTVNNSEVMQRFVENMRNAFEQKDSMDTFNTLMESRQELVDYFNKERVEQMQNFVRSIEDQNGRDDGVISRTLRTLTGQMLDTSIYADVIDKATGYTSKVREAVRFRPYGIGVASTNIDGHEFRDVRGHVVAGAKTLKDQFMDAYGDKKNMPGGFKETWNRVNQVLAAQAALDRINRGQNPFSDTSGLADDDIRKLATPNKETLEATVAQLSEADEHVLQAAENMRKWFMDVMQTYAVNPGFLSQDRYNSWKERDPHYAPLLRVMGDRVVGGEELAQAIGASSLSSVASEARGLMFKQAKGGSDRAIINPLESMITMSEILTKKAVDNLAAQEFARAFKSTEGLSFIAEKLTPEQAVLYKDGGPGERVLAVPVKDADGNNVMEHYIIHNPELYDLLSGTPRTDYSSLWVKGARIFGHFTRMMTRLTTGANPLFALKNAVKDIQKSIYYGSYASNYATGTLKWVKAFTETAFYKFRSELKEWLTGDGDVKVSQQMEDYLALGGGDYIRYGQGKGLKVDELRRSIGGESLLSRTGKHIGQLIGCASLNDAIEMASRYAEYKYGKNKTLDAEGATDESKLTAFMASREVTVDFAQGGDSTVAYVVRQLVPFWNATMQGKYQELRMFGGAERSRLGARLGKMILNNAIAGVLSHLVCMAFGGAYDDDDPKKAKWVTALEEYANISDSIKRDYLLLPFSALGATGSRDIIRIPLGHEFISRVAYEMGRSASENIMNAYYGREASLSDWGSDMVMAGLESLGELKDFTAITTPISDVMANKTWYGSELIRSTMLEDDYTNMYNPSTFDGFRVMGNIINNLFECAGITDQSLRMLGTPLGQEYLFKQYTGIIGQLIIPMVSPDNYTGEGVLPLESAMRVFENSWTLDAESSTDIPDAFNECWRKINSIKESGDNRKGLGILSRNLTDEQVTEAYEDAKELLSSKGGLGGIKQQISAEWSAYNDIMRDTSLSRREREEQAEQHRKNINRLYKQGITIAENYFDKYDIEPRLFQGFVDAFDLHSRVVTPMTNAQRNNRSVDRAYGDTVPESYTSETERLAEYYSNTYGKDVTSKIYATPNASYQSDKVNYKVADYAGAEEDVRTWYGEYYWPEYEKLITSYDYVNADEDGKINQLGKLDSKANDYAKKKFLAKYITQP